MVVLSFVKDIPVMGLNLIFCILMHQDKEKIMVICWLRPNQI